MYHRFHDGGLRPIRRAAPGAAGQARSPMTAAPRGFGQQMRHQARSAKTQRRRFFRIRMAGCWSGAALAQARRLPVILTLVISVNRRGSAGLDRETGPVKLNDVHVGSCMDGRHSPAARITLRRDPGGFTVPLCGRPVLLHGDGAPRADTSATAAWHRRQLAALALPASGPCRSLSTDRVERPRLSPERQSAR